MNIKYVCHHKDNSGNGYDKTFETFEEAQLSEAQNGGWIEKKISKGINN